MPKTKTTSLASAAAAEDAEKKRGKLSRALGAIASALGVESKPSAKMSKKTEVTKHTVTEESDSSAEEEEEEGSTGSDAEEEEGSTGSTGSEAETTGSTGSDAEEEEEEEERGSKAKKAAKPTEEEEEKATARAVAKAYRSSTVQDAFLAALPAGFRDVGALYSPHRLAAAARRATGTKSTAAAMSSFSTLQKRGGDASARVIKQIAKVETTVRKLKASDRAARVNAMVEVAKSNGRASSKDLRAQLRTYGAEHGTAKLSALIATLPAHRSVERIPRADGQGAPIGAPSHDEQTKIMDDVFAGLPPEQRAQAETDFKTRMNGSAPRAPRS